MRKKGLILTVAIVFLTGCGANISTDDGTANAPVAVEEPTQKTEEVPAEELQGKPPISFTQEEHDAAAQYLSGEYGIPVSEDKPKVILDCDMTYMGDDAMAMCILVQADTLGLIDLTGITVTGGNSCVAAETNAVLNQLELIGRADIPVYMGTDEPIDGFRDIDAQEKIVGKIQHWGLFYNLDDYVAPSEYHNLGNFFERKWGYSQTDPQEESSVEFMLEQAQNYPGQVTIIAVGPTTNIAMACQSDDSFARNIKEIIYLGTILDGSETFTPYADFNCFYDAKAFEICMGSEFPEQIIVPHDVVNQAVLNKAVFDLMDAKKDTLISQLWLESQYSLYKRTPTRKDNCSDAIAAVIFLNPAVAEASRELFVTINSNPADAEYGSITTNEEALQDSDAAKVRFILDLNTEVFWDFTTDLLCHMNEPFSASYADYLY